MKSIGSSWKRKSVSWFSFLSEVWCICMLKNGIVSLAETSLGDILSVRLIKLISVFRSSE